MVTVVGGEGEGVRLTCAGLLSEEMASCQKLLLLRGREVEASSTEAGGGGGGEVSIVTRLSVCLSTYLSIYVYMYLSICLSVCLSPPLPLPHKAVMSLQMCSSDPSLTAKTCEHRHTGSCDHHVTLSKHSLDQCCYGFPYNNSVLHWPARAVASGGRERGRRKWTVKGNKTMAELSQR